LLCKAVDLFAPVTGQCFMRFCNCCPACCCAHLARSMRGQESSCHRLYGRLPGEPSARSIHHPSPPPLPSPPPPPPPPGCAKRSKVGMLVSVNGCSDVWGLVPFTCKKSQAPRCTGLSIAGAGWSITGLHTRGPLSALNRIEHHWRRMEHHWRAAEGCLSEVLQCPDLYPWQLLSASPWQVCHISLCVTRSASRNARARARPTKHSAHQLLVAEQAGCCKLLSQVLLLQPHP
jgi:hypothetical protein